MTKITAYILVFLALSFGIANAQVTRRPDLYIFFKNDTSQKIFKRVLSQQNLKTGKRYQYNIYDYFYTSGDKHHYQFISKHTLPAIIVNSAHIKKLRPKSLMWLKQLNERLPASDSKSFPYKRIYLVERLKQDKYCVVEVETFIGKDF